jgi:hypothetical protein
MRAVLAERVPDSRSGSKISTSFRYSTKSSTVEYQLHETTRFRVPRGTRRTRSIHNRREAHSIPLPFECVHALACDARTTKSRCRSRARVRRAWHELCIRAHLWSPAACRSEELGVGHLNLFLLRTVRAALLRCCAPTKASTRSGLGRKQQSCFRPRQRCVTACGVGVGPPQSSVSLSLDQLCAAAFALHDWGSSKRRERSR